jgi:hypothetical protein
MINSRQRNRETQRRAYQQQEQIQGMGRQYFQGAPGNVIQGGAAWSGPAQFPPLPDAIQMPDLPQQPSTGKTIAGLAGAGLGAMACGEFALLAPACMELGSQGTQWAYDEAPVAWNWTKGAYNSVDSWFKNTFGQKGKDY